MDLSVDSLLNEPMNSSRSGAGDLRHVGMLDLLECDPRPTFVLDSTLMNELRESDIHPVYWNPAAATVDTGRLLHAYKGLAFSQFSRWFEQEDDSPFNYLGFSWMKILVAGRWNVISGTSIDTSAFNLSAEVDELALTKKTSRSKTPTFDWTDELPPLRISAHVAWARSIDWASTALGPMSEWSSQLRSVANLIMQDPRPAVGFYGTEYV
jgi:hypothetical protein